MKLIRLSISLFAWLYLIVEIYSTFTENKNRNKSKTQTATATATKSKTSIFESISKFAKQYPDVSLEPGKRPVNPFDPQAQAFEFRPDQDNIGSAIESQDMAIKPGVVVYKGWVKFFRYIHNSDPNKIKAFYENPDYVSQFKNLNNTMEVNEKQGNIYKHAHSKNHFFCEVNADEIVFSRNRYNAFQTQFDVLKIDYISPVSEDPGFNGGISNVGSFKEGECFRVETLKAGRWTWVICTEQNGEKLKLMNTIKKLVIQKQRHKGYVPTGSNPSGRNAMNYVPGLKNNFETVDEIFDNAEEKQPHVQGNGIDGYWVVLQDWSSCTKFCGGGTQTLHRTCIPPRPGGSPCQGLAIVNRTCNEHPCPQTQSIEDDLKQPGVKLFRPHLSVLPFSDRPQRYDKCHLKESDLLLTTTVTKKPFSSNKKEKYQAVQIPVRVVMNQYTIAAYAGLNETDRRVSFDLQKVNFFTSLRDPNCFELREVGVHENIEDEQSFRGENVPINRAELCSFGTSGAHDVKEEWDYDFHLFKHQCHEPKRVSPVLNDTEIEDELNKKKGQMKIDIINEKKRRNVKPVSQTTKLKEKSIEALQKELKLEQLIEQEIKDAHNDALENKNRELERERYKLDCLNRAIREKELENEFNAAQSMRDARINDLKKTVADTINSKRERLKAKIAKLKKLSSNQLRNMDTQIQNIRLEMMNSLNKANSMDPEKCKKLVQTKTDSEYARERMGYCNEKTIDDVEDHQKCMNANKDDIIKIVCDYETDPQKPEDFKTCVDNCKALVEKPFQDVRFFWAKPYNRQVTSNAFETINNSRLADPQSTNSASVGINQETSLSNLNNLKSSGVGASGSMALQTNQMMGHSSSSSFSSSSSSSASFSGMFSG